MPRQIQTVLRPEDFDLLIDLIGKGETDRAGIGVLLNHFLLAIRVFSLRHADRERNGGNTMGTFRHCAVALSGGTLRISAVRFSRVGNHRKRAAREGTEQSLHRVIGFAEPVRFPLIKSQTGRQSGVFRFNTLVSNVTATISAINAAP